MTQPLQRTHEWKSWVYIKPRSGQKVVIVCDDGCSSSLALMTDDGPIDGEDAIELSMNFLHGSMWIELPQDYPLAFMEVTEDDWR